MKQIKNITVLLLLIISSANTIFPSGYNIRVNIEELSDSTLFLAYHFGNRKYIKDTIRLDAQGNGVFKGDEDLPGGIYLVVMPEMKYFEIIIDQDQQFSIETSAEAPVKNMKIAGSEENELFLEYHRFMNERQSASASIQKRLENSHDNQDSVLYLRAAGRQLDAEVQEFWRSITDTHPGSLLAVMINAMINPQIPDFDIPADTKNPDSVRWAKGYEYNKRHFFDRIDFSDERLLRTPILHSKIEHFFTRILIQRPDSIIPEAVRVIELSKANDQVFQYVLVYLLNHFERSSIMGLDEVFVELAERYYLSGEAFWVTEETKQKLRERVERIKPNLIGRKAEDMRMSAPDGSMVSLHETEAEYIIVYFYEPECGHCKVVTPRLDQLYRQYREDGLEVFAVYIYGDTEEWNNYISSNSLDWINVFDPENETYFRFYYDIYSTPTIYILNSEKTIIAKRVGIETVEQIIEELM